MEMLHHYPDQYVQRASRPSCTRWMDLTRTTAKRQSWTKNTIKRLLAWTMASETHSKCWVSDAMWVSGDPTFTRTLASSPAFITNLCYAFRVNSQHLYLIIIIIIIWQFMRHCNMSTKSLQRQWISCVSTKRPGRNNSCMAGTLAILCLQESGTYSRPGVY